MTLPRWIALPVAAALAVATVLGVQLAHGGGTYEPLRPPSACTERTVAQQADGIEGLTESLVLIGLAEAACELGVSREQLTLDLAQQPTVTDEQVDALRTGLLAAVDRLEAAGTLPEASDLRDEALTNADLNPLVERALRALPGGVVNAAVRMDDVLPRAIESLDLREVLSNLDDPSALDAQVQQAVTQAVKDSLVDRIRGLLP